jgi:hypothetical protein
MKRNALWEDAHSSSESDHCSFSEYILPNNCIDKYASRVNKLSGRSVNGQRTLFKKAEQLATLTGLLWGGKSPKIAQNRGLKLSNFS